MRIVTSSMRVRQSEESWKKLSLKKLGGSRGRLSIPLFVDKDEALKHMTWISNRLNENRGV